MNNSLKVTAILTAFNEQPRIAKVLHPLLQSRLVSEIIAVDDGSTDGTSQEIAKFDRVTLVRNKRNLGKHHALNIGIKRAHGNIILFLDSDLNNLTTSIVDQLIIPVYKNAADIAMGYRNGNSIFKYIYFLTEPCLTGERCLKKSDYVKIITNKKLKNFQTETAMNKYFLDNRKKIAIVSCNKLTQTLKYKKYGMFRGWWNDFAMTVSIVYKFGFMEIFRQMIYISLFFHYKFMLSKSKNIIFIN